MPHKWENAFPLDTLSWGYRRDMQPDDVLSFKKLLQTIVSTVSCGGKSHNSISSILTQNILVILFIFSITYCYKFLTNQVNF